MSKAEIGNFSLRVGSNFLGRFFGHVSTCGQSEVFADTRAPWSVNLSPSILFSTHLTASVLCFRLLLYSRLELLSNELKFEERLQSKSSE